MNEIKKIEDWKKELKTPGYIFSGMKAYNDFAEGKELTKKEYETAVCNFLYNKKDEDKKPVIPKPKNIRQRKEVKIDNAEVKDAQ
ncbi:MAG: hypothetical protein JXB50_12265 [Spirochaetes bacterium]|nr:hypothetical protein [Spirochaetota bacterium]